MRIWHVWTDGSCKLAADGVTPRNWGGWCAIVEHGSEGTVLRGRVPDTTNVRMEYQAALEGFAVVPSRERVVLHTDCTGVLSAFDKWQAGGLRRVKKGSRYADQTHWVALAREFGRLDVTIQLVVKRQADQIHKRCHLIAGAEARGGIANLPANATKLSDELGGPHRIRQGMLRVASSPGIGSSC